MSDRHSAPRHRMKSFSLLLAVLAVVGCVIGSRLLAARLEGGVVMQQRMRAAARATKLELAPEKSSSETSSVTSSVTSGAPAPTADEPGLMTLHTIPTDLYPDAVCNDGSPAGFYFRKGGGSDDSGFALAEHRWLLFLQGGFWCWDEQSCTERTGIYPALMTSTKWTPTKKLGGIFSPDSSVSPLSTANRVFVPYCSSDAWVGDMGDGVLGFHFRGQAIVRAVMSELRRVYKIGGGTGGDELYFAGCSAGARGAISLIDSVPAMVPGVKVFGIFDSGLSLSLEPFGPSSLTPLTEQVQKVLVAHNAHSVLGAQCEAAYASEPWKCLVAEFRLPFLKRPHFISESQYDSFQLYWDLGGKQPPYSGAMSDYSHEFRLAMRSALMAAGDRGAGVHSSSCFKHCLSLSNEFYSGVLAPGTDGELTSFSGAVAHWMATKHSYGAVYIDNCWGFNCGCAAPPPPPPPPSPAPAPPATSSRTAGWSDMASDASEGEEEDESGASAQEEQETRRGRSFAEGYSGF